MRTIGMIQPERLKEIPKKHWAQHEFCFHLHDLMVQLLVQMEAQKAGHVKFKIESEEDRALLASGIHVLDFLEKTGRGDLERRAALNHLCNALYADILHFIYEGLRALEKRKFTVAFALLRKPLKDGLLIVAQMCADETALFDRMKADAKNLLNRQELGEAEIKALLAATIKVCGMDFANADSIYEAVFNRGNELGFAGLFDKATHLVTEYSKIQTENYNLNFIFKNPQDNDVYEGRTYPVLANLLLFLHVMQIELYGRMKPPSRKYQNWMLVTSIGAYETLFSSKQSRMVTFVNQAFKDFLKCATCDNLMKVRKADGARLFIAERIRCTNCRVDQHFPFGWLLSKLDLDLY